MALIDDLGEKLAMEVITAQTELGEDRLYQEVANYIGTSSPALEEVFLSACRTILSEQRGRQFFEQKVKTLQARKLAEGGTQ